MKKLMAWYQKFIRKHIICWPEEYFNPCCRPSDPEPVADANVLRSSVHRYFKYNQAGDSYVIPFEPLYMQTMEDMRNDGWQVELQCGAGGELFYTISSKIKNKAV
ncbi:hypothetical protein [Chitinophaga defluvii]|uniref:Uncharacterized protein n=1 Tax=Chitinophaga defluvii TaxID=3163343 RepID=A0ABV2T6N9_9BACT